MDVDKRKGRNCYNCGGFGHIARNHRNRRTGMNKKMEQKEDNSNLNGD